MSITLQSNPSEYNLELLLSNTEEPFVLVNRELNIITFNDQFAQQYFKFFKISIERGKSILTYAQKASSVSLAHIYEQALKGVNHEAEMEVKTSEGSFHFLLKYKPARNSQNDIAGVFVSSTDISEMKRSQERLKASESRFRSIINNANDIIYLTNEEGIVSYISPAITRVTGFTPEEITGKSMFHLIHPDQLETSNKILQEIIRQPGIAIPRINQFLHKKGHYVWVEGAAINLLNDENVGAIVVNYHDITHRKEVEENLRQKEERLKVIIDNEPECVKVVDLEGRLIEMNPAGLKMLEAESLDELRGQEVINLVHPEDRTVYLDLHKKSCKGEPGVASFRAYSLKKNMMWMETHFVPLRTTTGEVYSVLSVTRDITERKKTEERLEASEKRFKALVENAGDVMAVIGLNGTAIYVSPSITNVLGYSGDEPSSLNMFELLHPDDIAPVQAVMEKAFSQPGISLKGHTGRVKHKDGSWRWCESVVTNLLHDPLINGVVNNFRDVTEKVLAEQEREFDHNNLHALINNTNDLIWSISKDHKLISSNRAFDNMIKQLSGNDPVKGGDAPAAGFPEEQLKKWRALYARAFKGETFTIVEHSNFGKEYWSEISFYPILQGDEIIGTACYSRDITERKLFERKLEANTIEILNTKKELEYKESRLKQAQAIAHIGNWEHNLSTKTSFLSDEVYKIYGLEPNNHTFSPEQWKEFIHPEDLEVFEKELASAFKEQRNSTHSHRIIRKDGSIRYVVSESRLELDEEGSPKGVYGIVHDVTEDKEAEQQLKKSHELLQKLTDKVPVAIYQFKMDAEGRMSFPFMSKTIEELVPGIIMERLKGESTELFKNVHPEDVSNLISSIEKSRIELSDWILEFRMLMPDKTTRWFSGFSKPELQENKSVLWYGYLQDITERKFSEGEVRNSKERYDLIAGATNDAIWDWDLNTDKLYWGDGFRTLFGYDPKTKNLTINSWIDHIHPEDKERILKSVKNAIDSKVIQWQNEYRYVKADGTFADVLDRGYIMRDQEDKPLRMIGAMQDISERKFAAEEIRVAKERYDLVAKATNDSIYDWDLVNNTIIRTGNGLHILFGYNPEEIINQGDFWKQKIHPDDVESCYNKLSSYLENPDEKVCDMEYRFLKADGTYAFVYDKGYIVRNQAGKALRLIGATRDISSRKKNELLLKELNERLEKRAEQLALSNTELEQFAYIASHDLQEPLRMVTSFLTQLENKYKDQLDDKAKQYIHFATDGAIRMRRLVLDLLEYSRVGKQTAVKTQMNANILVQEAVKLNKVLIDEKNASVNWNNLPVIYASNTALLQIFQNLIGNALKYQLPGNTPLINITASETETHWQFAVSDNGIGIEERYFEKIFIVFQRLHNKDEYSGTGIGLAICKKIVENHKGNIWVESIFGHGSTFHFTLSKTYSVSKSA